MNKFLFGAIAAIAPLAGTAAEGSYTIVQQPAMTIAGIECRTSNDADAGPQDIPRLWERFFVENVYERIPNKASCEVIGLYCDYEGDHTLSYTLVVGTPVSSAENLPVGMVAKTVPATSYAVFRAVGEHPQSVIATWENIWQTPLSRTYTGDFEVYGDKFVNGDPKEVDIYIAIE